MDDPKEKSRQAQDQIAPDSLSKEKLANLLNDFLDQLIASTPPAPNGMNQVQVPIREPEPEQKRMPTPQELFLGWQQGGEAKLAEMLENMPEQNEDEE